MDFGLNLGHALSMLLIRFSAALCLLLALVFAYYKLRPANNNLSFEDSKSDVKKLTKPNLDTEVETHSPRPLPSTRMDLPKTLAITQHEKENHNLNIDPTWDNELYSILQQLDPENGDHIFKQFKQERIDHSDKIQLNLKKEIADLSLLNGESTPSSSDLNDLDSTNDLELIEFQHQKRIKQILGLHYDYIQNQYNHHRDAGGAE